MLGADRGLSCLINIDRQPRGENKAQRSIKRAAGVTIDGPSRARANTMRLTLRAEDLELDLAFDEPRALERFFEDAELQQGFMLQLERQLKQFARVNVTAKTHTENAGEVVFRCEAEVMQLFPGAGTYGTAFRLHDWGEHQREALARALRGERDGPPGGQRNAVATPGERVAAEAHRSPIFRIKAMNPTQRFQLAMKASRTERQILLRDPSPQVLMGLLSHPRLEDKEVLEIVKSNYASGGILQRVAESKKWMNNAEIRVFIVRNPKTPAPIAIKHLPSLRTSELQAMAKGSWCRESLRKVALKIYMKRTGQR